MLVDSRTLADDSSIDADIAIIGAGAAGITIAHELSKSKLKIAVVESGGLEFDADTQALYDGILTAHDNTDLVGSRIRFFGGTTNHWGGHCLPLDHIDFEPKQGYANSGWPLSRDDLEPFYLRAHAYCDVGSFEYDPLKASTIDKADLLPLDASIVQTVIDRQSPPTRFGAKFRHPLETSETVTVYLWANVVEIVQGQDRQVDRLSVKTLAGKTLTVKAQRYVLCCGAIENARILLMSKSFSQAGVGNDHDLVGRFYMDHLSGGAAFIALDSYRLPSIYSEDITSSDGVLLHYLTRLSDSAQRDNSLLNTSFWLIPFVTDQQERELAIRSRRGINALRNIAKYAVGRPEVSNISLSEEFCAFINNSDEIAQHALPGLSHPSSSTILLRFEAEQSPDANNRVSLFDTVDALGSPKTSLHWAPVEADFESIRRSAIIYGREVGRARIGRLQLEDKGDAAYRGVRTAWHHMGTTRMADNAAKGVVDRDCRVFGIHNLSIAGGSVFPTSGRSNPTLTIVALAIRLADKLRDESTRS